MDDTLTRVVEKTENQQWAEYFENRMEEVKKEASANYKLFSERNAILSASYEAQLHKAIELLKKS